MAMMLGAAVLVGCASPAPSLMGGHELRLWRGGHQMVIFRKGDRIEVIRLGYAPRAERRDLEDAMLTLMPEVTGCRLRGHGLSGDSGEMRARLSCPRGAPYPFTAAALAEAAALAQLDGQ